MKRAKKPTGVVRCRIALSQALVDEVTSTTPAPLRPEFDRLVRAALRHFAETQRANAFERAVQEMAADPRIQAQCRAIARDFAPTELDSSPDVL